MGRLIVGLAAAALLCGCTTPSGKDAAKADTSQFLITKQPDGRCLFRNRTTDERSLGACPEGT